MKRIIVAVVVMVTISLAACGLGCSGRSSGSASSAAKSAASETTAAQSVQLPDKNGFDEATNQVVNVQGVEFSLPAYFRESSNKDGAMTFSTTSGDGSSEDVIVICLSNPSATVASVEAFQEKKQSAAASLLNSDSFKNVKVVESTEGGVADLSSGIYTFTATYASKGKSYDVTARVGVFLNSNLQVGAIGLFQYNNTVKSNYLPDFDKVLASARVVEQAQSGETSAQGESGAVSPDVREMLDSYEAFMDEYIDFMQRYKDSGNTAAMMNDYLSYLQRYSDFIAKVNAVDSSSMSAADAAYYVEVTTRVSQKLLNAAV